MNKEDYDKYYIQGSDHYLIPKDAFLELFDEMVNWKNESINLKQALKEIREYCNIQIENNKELIEKLKGTSSFRIGNAQAMIKEYQNILQIIDKVLGDEENEC